MKRVLEAALRVNPKTAKAEFFDERPFVACSYGAARVSSRSLQPRNHLRLG